MRQWNKFWRLLDIAVFLYSSRICLVSFLSSQLGNKRFKYIFWRSDEQSHGKFTNEWQQTAHSYSDVSLDTVRWQIHRLERLVELYCSCPTWLRRKFLSPTTAAHASELYSHSKYLLARIYIVYEYKSLLTGFTGNLFTSTIKWWRFTVLGANAKGLPWWEIGL